MSDSVPLLAPDLIPAAIRDLRPYVPGKPISELEREYGVRDSIKLASNENPLGPGPLARAAMRRSIDEIGLYPDAGGYELKARIARHHGVPPECITLGNGSNDILVMLAEAFLTPDTDAVYSQHCFPVYPLVVQATGATARVAAALSPDDAMPLGHDLEALREAVTPRTRLVFIANPNNPTGTWLDAVSLYRMLRDLPSTVIAIVDEAYFEYSRDLNCADASAWVRQFPRLVVVRTFSKAYGLAGLRVGYALSHPEIAQVLNRVRQPFNVNSMALAAAAVALADIEHLHRTISLNDSARKLLRDGLIAQGLIVPRSAGNFVFFDVGRPANVVYESLLRRGVIVRPAGPALPRHLRVTTGTLPQTQRLLETFAEMLADR